MSTVASASRAELLDRAVQTCVGPGSRERGLLIVGVAGQGKTHLLRSVDAGLQAAGAVPVMALGTVAGREIPLAAFATMVARAEAVPRGLSPVHAVIREVTTSRVRTCLLVDNVDRLDSASLFVVAHLVRDPRVPVVMTARDGEALPEAMRELYDDGAVDVVRLAPLTHRDVIAVGEELLDGPLTPRAAGVLVEHSDGNPLYARELISGSRHSGALVETPHGWDFPAGPQATPRLAQLIGAAFDGLDESWVTTAGIIAVADGMPADALDQDHVHALARRGVVAVQDGTAHLSHPLFGEALLARTPAALLSTFQGQAFAVLHERRDRLDPAARARWVDLGVRAQREIPRDAVVAESRRVLRLMDYDRAWALASHVLEVAPQDAEALGIAGAAASGRGELDVAEDLLQRAVDAAAAPTVWGSAIRSLAHHHAVRRHQPLVAAELLARALERAHDPSVRTRIEHDLVQWQMVGGALAQMPEPAHTGNDASYAHHLAVTLMVTLITGPLSDAEATSRALDAVLPRHQDDVPTGSAIARLGRFMLLAYSGDIVAAREMALRFLSPDDASPEMRGAWEYSLGMIELLSGSVARTRDLAQDAVVHLRWRDPLGLLPAALALAEAAHAAMGDVAAAADFASQIPEAMLADPKVAMLRAWSEAWAAREAGRRGVAATILVEAAAHLVAVKHAFLAGMLAHCATRAGHPEQALTVLQDAADAEGVAQLFLAHAHILARKDSDALAEHLDRMVRLGMVAGAADAMSWQARTARARGDVMAARRWEWRLQRSLDDHPSMALWLHDIPAGESLSAREREVALLAAGRLSSREIAERLGIAPKTVANQLGAVYRKLGVSGRAELREMLAADANLSGG